VGKPDVIVIPKEKTVFWMDGNGRWCNDFGRFEKKKIIDYFHAAIHRDADGYFVQQDKEGVIEKVYFYYEDTALFVFHLTLGNSIKIRLNTGKELALKPETLWIENDNLYLRHEGERIKFTDRAMMKIAAIMEDVDDECVIRIQGRSYHIPEIHAEGRT
jgi:hypothetical protein